MHGLTHGQRLCASLRGDFARFGFPFGLIECHYSYLSFDLNSTIHINLSNSDLRGRNIDTKHAKTKTDNQILHFGILLFFDT